MRKAQVRRRQSGINRRATPACARNGITNRFADNIGGHRGLGFVRFRNSTFPKPDADQKIELFAKAVIDLPANMLIS
jgi:hypothetical protein